MALAAATAAIAPAVLLAAPAAFASVPPSPTATETTAGENETDSNEPSDPGKTAESTESNESNTSNNEESNSEEADPAGKKPASGEEEKSGEEAPPAGGEDAATPTATAPTPSASPSRGPQPCKDAKAKSDKNLRTSLTGLPSKVVAGSGFHDFKLNVENTGDNSYKRVDMGVAAALIDDKRFTDQTRHLTLQYKDPVSGTWENISQDAKDPAYAYVAYTDIKAKESFSVDLRLSVDKTAPAGLGIAITIGMYADDKGNCVYATDKDYYQFDVLAAGTSAGNPPDAKPQGGRKELPAKPVGDRQIVPQGHLAETGSSSALPMIALAGGAAVAVGAGAVFVVRRRKAGSGAAAA
ncbi:MULTISPECIES: LAETG motif-containing sortase-dependent surface protein [unclassified Streptomyces]|uniref:LAETG motif-containing sortase-dependent surface protein n=1 Tax=unclassified Streptomyces TaxID=2593676 RepID=UPI00340679A2